MKRRMAWGKSIKKGVALGEFELGSRVVSDIMSENIAAIADKVLASRIDRAGKIAAARVQAELRPFVGCYIKLKDDLTIWLCEDITNAYGEKKEKYGPHDLKVRRFFPEPKPPYGEKYRLMEYIFPHMIDRAWDMEAFAEFRDGRWYEGVPPYLWGRETIT